MQRGALTEQLSHRREHPVGRAPVSAREPGSVTTSLLHPPHASTHPRGTVRAGSARGSERIATRTRLSSRRDPRKPRRTARWRARYGGVVWWMHQFGQKDKSGRTSAALSSSPVPPLLRRNSCASTPAPAHASLRRVKHHGKRRPVTDRRRRELWREPGRDANARRHRAPPPSGPASARCDADMLGTARASPRWRQARPSAQRDLQYGSRRPQSLASGTALQARTTRRGSPGRGQISRRSPVQGVNERAPDSGSWRARNPANSSRPLLGESIPPVPAGDRPLADPTKPELPHESRGGSRVIAHARPGRRNASGSLIAQGTTRDQELRPW